MGNAANMLLILGLVTPSYAKPNTENVVQNQANFIGIISDLK